MLYVRDLTATFYPYYEYRFAVIENIGRVKRDRSATGILSLAIACNTRVNNIMLQS